MRRLLLLGFVVLVLPGCPWFIPRYTTLDPEVDLTKKTLLVVPFSDTDNTYFASQDGNALAGLVIREVSTGAKKARLVDPEELRRLFPGRDLESVGWQNVGQAVGADYVLVGHIESFRLKDSGSPNLYMGTIVLRLKVVNAADGSVVWSAAPPDTRYRWSASGHPTVGTSILDISEEAMRQGTLAWTSRQIGDVFCPRRITTAEAKRRERVRGRMLGP